IERNDSRVVVHLDQDRHVARTLNNPVVVVVRLRQHRYGGTEQDAPLSAAAILRTIRRADGFVLRPRIDLLLRLRRKRRDSSVWRVDDERRATALHTARAALEEGVVGGADLTPPPRPIGVGRLNALLLPGCSLVSREERLRPEL